MNKKTINLYASQVIFDDLDEAISKFNEKYPAQSTNRNSEIVKAIDKHTKFLQKEIDK